MHKKSAVFDFIRPAAVLFVICLVIGASLALTYAMTKERISESEAVEANKARTDVLPAAAFETVFSLGEAEISALAEYPAVVGIYAAKSEKNGAAEPDGYVATVLANGYGGVLSVTVGVAADGKISGVRVTKHSETPGLGANAAQPDFYEQFAGMDSSPQLNVVKGVAAPAGNEVSAVSGATVTSTAVTEAVNAATAAIGKISG